MKVAALRNVSWDDGPESAVRLWNQARNTGEGGGGGAGSERHHRIDSFL